MNKGELMKTIYTDDELKSIDPSLPLGWECFSEITNREDSYWFVMNYNESCFGCLEDMRLTANERNIEIEEI